LVGVPVDHGDQFASSVCSSMISAMRVSDLAVSVALLEQREQVHWNPQ
jgi:predicted O-linked N-acetylglucosamine transferase (SPINDLY family)